MCPPTSLWSSHSPLLMFPCSSQSSSSLVANPNCRRSSSSSSRTYNSLNGIFSPAFPHSSWFRHLTTWVTLLLTFCMPLPFPSGSSRCFFWAAKTRWEVSCRPTNELSVVVWTFFLPCSSLLLLSQPFTLRSWGCVHTRVKNFFVYCEFCCCVLTNQSGFWDMPLQACPLLIASTLIAPQKTHLCWFMQGNTCFFTSAR